MKGLLAISLLLFSATAFAVDSDGDGVDDSMDAFPNNPEATTDTDGDGKPDVISLNNPVFADSFESGNFTAGGWILGGTMTGTPWTIYSYGGSNGKVAKLAQISSCFMVTPCPVAYMQKTVTMPSGGGTVSFSLKGWVGFDFGPAAFYIDNVLSQQWDGGLSNWTPVTKTVPAGAHVLKWQTSGGFGTTGYVYIDAVVVTGSSLLIQDTDDDNDGVLDAADKFPLDPTETVDNDNDGTGNNADTDDDNDGMPDAWEITYGFNPLANDANSDFDGDGISNLQEFINGSNPTINAINNDYNGDGVAGWIWKGISNGNETSSQNWQLTFPLYSPNWAIPNRFYHPIFPDQLNWEIVTSGDFNKDGDADILWRNTSTAEWKVWQIQNGLRAAQNTPPDFDLAHAWQVIGAGDTDKDGDDDVVLNNITTGEVLIWQMQGHAVVNTHNFGSASPYLVNRIGDFDKDGDVDLLFRLTGGDTLATWEIQNNTYVAAHALANTGTNYNPVCAGDFDNDGDDDIMLVNTATTQEKWFVMENFARSQVVGSTNTGFVFKGCGDYDGDGDADILWQRLSDDANRVILQQNYGATKQTVYTNAFGAVSGFVYRGNSN